MNLYDAITLALLIRSDPNQLPSYTFGALVPVAFQCSAEDAVILCDGFFIIIIIIIIASAEKARNVVK